MPAITSDELVGTTVEWKGRTFDIAQENLAQWVGRQLPPAGTPGHNDAAMLDWRREGDLYLNEPESASVWPGFRSATPGTRPPFYFNPVTGKLAYPFLRPHLGKRPPFAPNHGPAPYLSPIQQGRDPPGPGENGSWSLCPEGTKLKEFVIHAINLPIVLNEKANLVDPVGQMFVLKEHEDAVRADNRLKVPLAIRANAGEDCVDVVFKSELDDTGENNFFSKVNIHIHFVQFDVPASDGVNTGFNYEQSVRPFTSEAARLMTGSSSGEVEVKLDGVDRFHPGTLVGVGMGQGDTFEIKRIRRVQADRLVFEKPLKHAHAIDEIVSNEFVRYRWYPDVQFGTAYLHDHVSALTSWRHGLFGALISEPPRSTYHDPHTGEYVNSGPIVDIHTDAVVSADISGSFRELVMFIQDDNARTNVGDSSGSSFNLRVEPLSVRRRDTATMFSSAAHGDPETPLLEAFLGDLIVVRGLVSATNDVHTWHVDGHWFRQEPYSETSPPISTIHMGISERYDLMIPAAGGSGGFAGDYLYYSGRAFKLREGSWGIVRVYDSEARVLLRKLPGREETPSPGSLVCPPTAPRKAFQVSAIDAYLPMLGNAFGKMYVLQEDLASVRSGILAPEPLVLHVNVGDCVEVNLTNATKQGPVSLHADMLTYDPGDSAGVSAGLNPVQRVLPGESHVYTYFAHPDVGETVALVRDWGNVLENPRDGLYGAIVVGPEGAQYADSMTGVDVGLRASWRVDVHPEGGRSYRDFTVFIQDEDEVIGTHLMPYTEKVKGVIALNYNFEPLDHRLAENPDRPSVFDSGVHGDPVRLHVLVPFSEQAHVFTVEGHRWPVEPGRPGSDLLSSIQIGGLEAITVVLESGAGGAALLPGDYLYGDHREPYREAGLRGILRVDPQDAVGVDLRSLTGD